MWQCEKCGREFENLNQGHFCGKAADIDEYIAAQATEVQPLLRQIRETIRAAAPDAVEKISWQMPTFWQPKVGSRGENLIHFAAAKKHIGIYPGGEAVGVFAERLAEYKTSKGAIQFPTNKPVDFELIAEITRWRVEKVRGKTL